MSEGRAVCEERAVREVHHARGKMHGVKAGCAVSEVISDAWSYPFVFRSAKKLPIPNSDAVVAPSGAPVILFAMVSKRCPSCRRRSRRKNVRNTAEQGSVHVKGGVRAVPR